ncbi:uncharacterized protein LOC122813971 isoform X2 [Protopterus annectens]|uniref:uncharacterized protein LOC122813971 isoform X2 n=1 Tax=Protopterus annectens TaxID=7888 RepID=UPI001CFAD1DC|nr:uncharacterized protein LOC122813971 isoform X2 [Protopterus annectens]
MVVILIFLITFFSSSRATLTATTTSSHVKARIGSDVLLNCQFNTGQSQIDLKLLAVSWFLGHERVATYDDKLTTYRPSVAMSVDELQNGNASLLIKGTKVTDEGTYICKVIYTPERDQSQLTLSTEAPPTVNILSQAVVKNEHSFLRASAVGFYPKQITVLWFRDGKSMNNPTFQKSEMNDDGTFNINSYLTFVPTDSDSKITFSCRVIHTSLPEPIQRDFQLIFGVSPKVKIHSSPFVKNVEQTLKCEVTGFYPETIALNWLKNGQRVDRKNTNKDGTYNVEGYYSFTPNEEDEGSEISCEVQHETLQQPFSQKIEVKVISKPDAGLNTALIVGLVLCFLLLLLICVIAGALVYKRKNGNMLTVKTDPSPVKFPLGSDAVLNCHFDVQKPVQVKYLAIEWRLKPDKPLIKYDNNITIYGREAKMFPDEFVKGNASLLLPSIKVTDQGDYLCRIIYNPNNEESSVTITTEGQDRECNENTTKMIISIAAVLFIVIIIICGLMYVFKKKNKKVIILGIEGPDIWVIGEDVTLTCSVISFSKCSFKTTWVKKNNERTQTLNDDDQESDEKVGLMISQKQYQIKACQPTASIYKTSVFKTTMQEETKSALNIHKTSITFQPSIQDDTGETFGCRITQATSRSSIMKYFRRFTLVARPKVCEQIYQSYIKKGVPCFAVDVANVYPKEIQLIWKCCTGTEEADISENTEFMENDDKTFTVKSTCQIPESKLACPNVKISVSFGYVSLGQTITKELLLKAEPAISEIMSSNDKEGKMRTFYLEADHFFPQKITIEWNCGCGDYKKHSFNSPDPSMVFTSNTDGTYYVKSKCELSEEQITKLRECGLQARILHESRKTGVVKMYSFTA